MQNRKDEHSSSNFLKSLYQHCEDGSINLRFFHKYKEPEKTVSKFIPLLDIESIPKMLKNYIEEYDCYFGICTRFNGDGSKDGIIQIPALWIDLDVYKLTDEQKEISRQRYKNFPLIPSFIINSGGGLYFFWLLKEPSSKDEIPRVENLLKRLATYFHGDMNATDASRILRIPGSLNQKYPYLPKVIIKETHPERQYNLDDFEVVLPEIEKPPHQTGEDQGQYNQEKTERLNQIMECEFLKHCDCDRATLSEPEWYGMISILARETGGPNLIHDLSLGYPKYSPGETDKKILHALNDAGPATCERIKTIWDCKKDCGIRSPAVLAFRPKEDESRNHSSLHSESKETHKGINYRLTTLNDVFEYPEPTFIIDQILVEGTVNVFGAYTGAGKSITTLSVIKSVLTGQSLWKKYPVLKTGPVLLVDEETPRGFLRERVEKMDFDKSLPFYFLHFQEVRLDRDDCFNALMEKIGEVKPILVVIDSLIRVHRQKEDDSTSMALVVARLRKIANSGATLWTIHHHKKGEGPLSQKLRGSSDIPGGVDIEYALIPKDDYLIFSSVKTRTKPLAPIRLKLDVSETEIRLTYEGTEAEEVLAEVIDLLNNKGRLGVNEIWEELKAREYEIGINKLREVLRDAVCKEIQGEKEKGRGKRWVFWVNDSSRFTAIYNTVKSEETKQNSVDSSQEPKKEKTSREETSQFFQGDIDSSWVKKHGVREELRDKNGYEIRDDGQFTY